MKGVYCYLFIHWLLYTINPFGVNRKQQMLWRRNSKTKYLELTEGYIYRLVPKPHSVWCLFLMQIGVSGKQVPWWGCWSWSQTPCCLLSSAAAMKKESLNHSALSHAHCCFRELPWRRGLLVDSCGGPRHRAPMVAALCLLLGLKQSLQNVVSSCSEKLRRGTLLPDPSKPSTHLRLKCAAAAGLTHHLRALLCNSQGDRPPFFFSKLCTAVRWLWAYPQASVQFSKLSHTKKFLCVPGERGQPFWEPREAVGKHWGWCLHAEELSLFLLLDVQCYAPHR